MPSTGSLRGQRCPRCSAPIEGDYKFCPACAFRLKAGAPEPAVARPSRSSWRARLLGGAVATALIGCAFLGVFLFRPAWFQAQTPPRPESPSVVIARLPALTVDDIPRQMIELTPSGEARWHREIIDGSNVEFSPEIIHGYRLFVQDMEVTCGQYAEYVRDVSENRERMPTVLTKRDGVPADDVNLYDHIPLRWIARDEDGAPVGWELADDERNLPVTEVSFYDAKAFAEWAGARLGRSLAIPVALEWARAARAGRLSNLWPWGDARLLYACNNTARYFSKRGQPLPVQWRYEEGNGGVTLEGLWAMAGNVREWAEDHDLEERHYADGSKYWLWKSQPSANGAWACGGSFLRGIDDCTADSQEWLRFDHRFDDLGFRLVERRSD
jgi:formylglycine-generating enzyme required for sulfatase activity